jgi:nitroimidazol reductase NimA-like FMN-containing flavoprotein (pyridoxamine 5'-phosphate oxidase superfamily)
MREAGYGSPLSEPQQTEFLKHEAIGTLAVSTGQGTPPYTLPMAYAYNGVTDIVFQFIVHTDSEKMEYIQNGTAATLTVTDHQRGGWVSCMVQGELLRVPKDERQKAELTFDDHGPEIEIDLFQEREDYHLEYWNLEAGEIHGRHSGSRPFPV